MKNNIDILLINPPCILKKGNFWKDLLASTPALGLGYLAATLEKRGFSAGILDAAVEGKVLEDIAPMLQANTAPWVGVSATSYTFDSAVQVAREVKTRCPETNVVLGGIHPTLFPEEALQHPFIDCVVRREGDLTLPELLEGRPRDTIAGISYRDNGKLVHNPDRPLIQNLDDIPFPAYHLLPVAQGRLTLGCAKRTPAAMLIGSRGCPFKCTFCTTAAMGKQVRYRSPENILEEIKLLMNNHGIREIHFQDDNFTLKQDNVAGFCELLLRENIDVSWLCMARVTSVTPEVLDLMKKAGCHQICFGIESGDETILKNIGKNITLDQVRKAVGWTRQAGIDTRGSFMLGCPGETEATLQKSLDFMKELDLDLVSINILTPMPGTEIRRWAQREGLLMTEDWNDYTFTRSVIRLPTIAPETVDQYLRKIYREFYLRPSYISKRLLKIRSLEDIKMNIKAALLLIKS